MITANEHWPSLPLSEWRESCETLHRWSQIVGKIRLAQMPWINHSWHVPLYLTARGLTTSPIPYGRYSFQIDFDFIDHQLVISVSDGRARRLHLWNQSVARFYQQVFDALQSLGIHISIYGCPSEMEDALPFAEDEVHAAYDAQYANRLWHALLQTEKVLTRFRSPFIGKCSPVHFFWGGFDLAVTRFSGRSAPLHPGGVPNLPDEVAREAYSHEVSSAGFWPGGGPHPFPLFYSYAYPEPEHFSTAAVQPKEAFYSQELHEFVLPYDVVREAAAPCQTLSDFLQSTYEAAANLGAWPRQLLERQPGLGLHPPR